MPSRALILALIFAPAASAATDGADLLFRRQGG